MERLGAVPDAKLVDDLRGIPTRLALKVVCQRVGINCQDSALLVELETIKNEVRDRAIEKLTQEDVAPGALSFLKECRRAGTKVICVATSTATPRVISQLQLDNLIDDTRYGDMVTPPKALSSEYIESIVAEYRVAKRALLVLDDGWPVVSHCLKAEIPAVVIGGHSPWQSFPHGQLSDGLIELYKRGARLPT
jgi:beta-phosphoglucomutase-like phosphatase (HAD superfamily)